MEFHQNLHFILKIEQKTMLQLYETISKQKYLKKTLFRKNNFEGITTPNIKKKTTEP